MNGKQGDQSLFVRGQAGEMQMTFLTCMDLSEKEKSGRWKHGGIAGIRIRGGIWQKTDPSR
jgi:hypothetical protein